MNNSFVGEHYTWELNNNGKLTVKGNIVDVLLYHAGHEHDVSDSYIGPMKVDENGIAFVNGIAPVSKNEFRFDPNHIGSITISEHDSTIFAAFAYSEDNQQRIICLSTYSSPKPKILSRELLAKDFCKIFPAIVDTAKTLTHEKIQRNQRMMEAQQQQKVMIERGALEKLKKLVKVSTKLKISQMAQILKMSESDLYDHIVDWATDYGFTLDEDVVIFGVGNKDDFIESLDNAFASWDKKTETKDGKLE